MVMGLPVPGGSHVPAGPDRVGFLQGGQSDGEYGGNWTDVPRQGASAARTVAHRAGGWVPGGGGGGREAGLVRAPDGGAGAGESRRAGVHAFLPRNVRRDRCCYPLYLLPVL